MATAAKAGKGLTFQIDTTGGGVYATIGEILTISGLKETMNLIDATSLDSTYGEVIPSLVDYGEINITMLWVPANAQQQQARTDLRAGTHRAFKITAADHTVGTIVTFTAYIKELSGLEVGGAKDALKQSMTVKVNSVPSVTYGHA